MENNILKLTIDEVGEILSLSQNSIKIYGRNEILSNKLFEEGYKLLEKPTRKNKFYTVEKIKDHIKEDVIEDKDNYIIISKKLKQGKTTNWKKSIGTHLIGKYKGIDFDFEIVDYQTKNCILTILHNGELKKLYAGDVTRFKGFDILLGIKTYDFKYEIGQRIIDYDDNRNIKRDFTIIDRKKGKDETGHSWRYYKIKCNKCGFDGGKHYYNGEMVEEHWTRESHLINGHGCGCCGGQFCVTGINDMWTTNPKLAELLADEEDGYKYIQGTTIKLKFKCPFCKNIFKKSPSNIIKHNYKVSCNCNDGVSYPEKFMWRVLNMLNVDYTWQYSKATCDWIINNIKYDFYFKYNNEEYIIETHGCQHYERGFVGVGGRTLEEEQENDRLKKELALNNGIKEENYIVIDCRKSDMEWIKNNILHSSLSKLFNLNQVDWLKCSEYACKNIYKEICDMWNDLGDKKSTTMIKENTKFSSMIIKTALKKGNELGWCDYNPNVNYKNDIYLKVTDLEDSLLGVYRGYKDLQDCSEEQFEKFLSHTFLWCFINTTKDMSVGNIKITLTTKEYYEKHKNLKIKYTYKEKYIKMTYDNIDFYFENCSKCAEYINHNFPNNKASSSALGKNIKTLGVYKNKFYLSYIFLTENEFNDLNSYNL